MLNLRLRWKGLFQPALRDRRLIFIDETGVNLTLTRSYGRAPQGKRAVGAVPKNYGQSVTLIGALSREGMIGSFCFLGSTDTEAMRVFVREVLLPQLIPGDVVIWDNLAVHKTRAVLLDFEQAEIEVLFLPPYSPDLNPIELCWSKLKTYLRATAARNYEALYQAISAALLTITANDSINWLRHCDYV